MADKTNLNALNCIAVNYDFANDGGAVGNIPLAVAFNPGDIVINAILRIRTPLASGGAATAAIKIMSGGDIVAASVISGAPWNSAGETLGTPVFATPSTYVVVSGTPVISPTLGITALTPRPFDVFFMFF